MTEDAPSPTSIPGPIAIVPVRNADDLKAAVELMTEYVQWLDLDLSFQGWSKEVASMPGKYAPPTGELLLAKSEGGDNLGCVALRPFSGTICEMKRLWVRDTAKGLGVGKGLVTAVINAAKKLGYQAIRLDTLPRMTAALKMYASFGFVEIEPYYTTPLPGTHFLELDLNTSPAQASQSPKPL